MIRPDNHVPGDELNADMAIANALLRGPVFKQDNRELYSMLVELTTGGPGITHVRAFEKTNDGRAAYWALDRNFNNFNGIVQVIKNQESK